MFLPYLLVAAVALGAIMIGELRPREGDVVELRDGAPAPAFRWLRPGVQGRVVIADGAGTPDPSPEVTVAFVGHRTQPIRLHWRWLRVVGRAPRPGRRRL